MNSFRILFLMVFLAGLFLSGCATQINKYPTTGPGSVYDQPGKSVGISPEDNSYSDQQMPQPEAPYGTSQIDPFAVPQKPLPPPRIGYDVPSQSSTSDAYLFAAVSSLEAQSEQLLAQGKTDQAFAIAERAIRIDPSNANIWNLLARIQLGQGNYSQAEQLSRKSNYFAKNNKRLQAENWRIIAMALREKGNISEAERVLEKVLELEKN
jgi:tetratricopeptide (TPR) repeat protein